MAKREVDSTGINYEVNTRIIVSICFNFADLALRLCDLDIKVEGVPYNVCVSLSSEPVEDITVNLRSNSVGMLCYKK